jgi:hypothetical protein
MGTDLFTLLIFVQCFAHTDYRLILTKDRPDLSSERVDISWLSWRGPAATVNYKPVLSSERALQNNKPASVWRHSQGERKIGRGSQMGVWHQDWLADWLSDWLWQRLSMTDQISRQRGRPTKTRKQLSYRNLQMKITSGHKPRVGSTPRQSRLTDRRNLTSTSTSTSI